MEKNKRHYIRMVMAVVISIILAVGVTGCTGNGGTASGDTDYNIVSDTAFMLDTTVSVTLYDWEDESTLDKAFDEIDRLDKLLNVNAAGSDLEKLYLAAGKDYTEVSEDTLYVISTSLKYSELSGGLFDITAGPFISLWNIKDGSGHIPTAEELEEVLPLIDYKKILINGNKVMLQEPGMKANLGAIAKGYIADKVKEVLINEGVEHAIINLGGNVVTIGGKPEGNPFKIGIQDPFEGTGDIIATLEVDNMSLVSSGSYERYFEENGVRYHHILDPTTGFPSDSGLAGITIISEKSIDGDALSTSVFLLGLDAGKELIESLDGVEAVFITEAGDIIVTPGLEGKLIQ